MLVKVGDVWVDPLRVEAMEFVPAIPGSGPVDAPVSANDSVMYFTMSPRPACVRINMDDSSYQECYIALGVSLDDAAAIINRAREAHMGGKR